MPLIPLFAYGFGTAITWAIGNVLIKSQVGRLETPVLLAIRAFAGAIISILAWVVFAYAVDVASFGEMSLEQDPSISYSLLTKKLLPFLAMFLASLTGYFGADLLFVRALEDLPLSYIFPIQASYPMIAAGLAWLIFGDPFTLWMSLGVVLVILGVSLIGSQEPLRIAGTASPGKENCSSPRRLHLLSFMLTGLSAVGWGFSAICIRWGLLYGNSFEVNAGVALITAFLFIALARPGRILAALHQQVTPSRTIAIAGLIGGTGFANLLFVLAVQTLGVARSTVLASTAPVFNSIFAVAFLGERMTVRLGLGTLLVVFGIVLLVSIAS